MRGARGTVPSLFYFVLKTNRLTINFKKLEKFKPVKLNVLDGIVRCRSHLGHESLPRYSNIFQDELSCSSISSSQLEGYVIFHMFSTKNQWLFCLLLHSCKQLPLATNLLRPSLAFRVVTRKGCIKACAFQFWGYVLGRWTTCCAVKRHVFKLKFTQKMDVKLS